MWIAILVIETLFLAIQEQLSNNNVLKPTLRQVADAVIAIRQSKLPNPKEIGNSGSFFKNPIISLTDQANFKGFTYKNAGVHHKQALVLVNKTGNATGLEILELSELIKNKIKEIYGIQLETEVNIF